MDIDINTDPVSGLTDQEKYNNFLKIMATAQYLDDGGRITEDWMIEHRQLILTYREWVPDYTNVNDEIEESGFRKCCAETEILLRQLCHTIDRREWFDVKIYHIFIRHMKQILETVMGEDELEALMNMLSI